MTQQNKSLNVLRTAVACLSVLGAAQAMATSDITGKVTTRVSSDGYAANFTNITFSGGTTAAYGGAGVLVCIDAFGDFPALGSTHSYSVLPTASTVIAAPTFTNRAEAMIDWVVDHYYTQFVNQTISGYAFNQTLWEITTDYNGTAASLSSTTGSIFKDPTQNWGPEYPTMLNALKTAMAQSTWSDNFRSATYQTTFLKDLGTAPTGSLRYQNMVLVTAVPEPSTYLMMFAGVGALMVMRRRAARR